MLWEHVEKDKRAAARNIGMAAETAFVSCMPSTEELWLITTATHRGQGSVAL